MTILQAAIGFGLFIIFFAFLVWLLASVLSYVLLAKIFANNSKVVNLVYSLLVGILLTCGSLGILWLLMRDVVFM